MTDDPIPKNPFPNPARRAGAKLEPIAADQLAARLPEPPRARGAAEVRRPRRGLESAVARRRLGLGADTLPPPARTIAVGESIRPRIGDELGPTTPDTDVRDMTDDLLRRAAHRRAGLELDDALAAQRRLTELVWDLEAQVTELRARDMSIVGAVVRTLRKRLRGDR